MNKLRVITTPTLFIPKGIAKVERMKNARYVCETCLLGKNGWVNSPVAIFWNRDPANIPAGGSPWFGLFSQPEYPDPDAPMKLYITNAISAVEHPIDGVVADNGDVIYSRYRHDNRESPDGSVWVDGGRDYTRTHPDYQIVKLQIIEDELKVI